MEVLLYVSALIAAIAFAVLVFYLAGTLKSVQRTMNNVANTLEGLEKQMEGITVETAALLNKTNKLAEDIQHKSQRMNNLVEGIYGVGESVKQFNGSLQKISTEIVRESENNKATAAQAVKWGQAIIDLWKKYKR
ncbi:uncharacterized protein YoxC [Salirhabdus euzebyi]|uniref:Uncharacterized protein YoxC n=1 Tax=Salirhabdus euzebyi TaxID=394506 RepID=A0A841PWD3_9BACI|nr:DUF948 domain-containing protein [Salirhabdus euzebyi]MBB6452144.1 uncharacterized protein YoxC [Salirhabdus euzebyi]